MPFTSVTRAISNPRFQSAFTVERRSETVGNDGFAVLTPTPIAAKGVICSASPSDLERLPDEQHMGRSHSIVTRFRLQGPSPGKQADVVIYRGNRFLVVSVDDYTEWGSGWVQAIVTSMNHIDTAPGNRPPC